MRCRRLKRGVRVLVILPPYSPDLNPIEQVFSKLKRLLRKADERTLEATWKRLGMLLDHFHPRESLIPAKKARLSTPDSGFD